LTRSATDALASSMMRLQAALSISGLSALAAHAPRSAGVAASAGIASRRATQRSSRPGPRATMLFPLRPALQHGTYGRDDFSPNGRHSAIIRVPVIGRPLRQRSLEQRRERLARPRAHTTSSGNRQRLRGDIAAAEAVGPPDTVDCGIGATLR